MRTQSEIVLIICYAPPLIGGGIKRWYIDAVWRLSRTSGLSREQRGLGRLNCHKSSPRHTQLGYYFQGQKVKGQGHQVALLTAVLVRHAAAAVGVGTNWPWETVATLPSARRRQAIRRPREKRDGAYIVAAARLQLVLSGSSCLSSWLLLNRPITAKPLVGAKSRNWTARITQIQLFR